MYDSGPQKHWDSVRDSVLHHQSRRDTIRILSYNIQTGITTNQYRDYFTKSWKHLLPSRKRDNLDLIASQISPYDLVALQEVDCGSLKTGYVNQIQYLAEHAHFPFWHFQRNRNLGHLGQHSNGFVSRLRPTTIRHLKLPGLPGRGAQVMLFGDPSEPLVCVNLHLALGRSRRKQIAYLAKYVHRFEHVIVMGDWNCQLDSNEMRDLLYRTTLIQPECPLATYPSWSPNRQIDHILVTPTMEIESAEVLGFSTSDHLPLTLTVRLPAKLAKSI